jgi:hypothetical protein
MAKKKKSSVYKKKNRPGITMAPTGQNCLQLRTTVFAYLVLLLNVYFSVLKILIAWPGSK